MYREERKKRIEEKKERVKAMFEKANEYNPYHKTK